MTVQTISHCLLALYHSGLESQHKNNDLTARAAKIYLGANTIIPQQKPNTPEKELQDSSGDISNNKVLTKRQQNEGIYDYILRFILNLLTLYLRNSKC